MCSLFHAHPSYYHTLTPSHTHTHSPTIGEDFLSDLDLQPINCVVGGAHKSPSRASSAGNIERLHSYTDDTYISGAGPNVRQIRIVTEVCLINSGWVGLLACSCTDGCSHCVYSSPHTNTRPRQQSDSETRSSNSYGRSEVKTHSVSRRHKKKTKEETDFVFLDRKSIISNADHLRDYPEAKRLIEKESSPSSEPASLVNQTRELNISSSSPQQPGRQPLPLKQLTQKLRTVGYGVACESSVCIPLHCPPLCVVNGRQFHMQDYFPTCELHAYDTCSTVDAHSYFILSHTH